MKISIPRRHFHVRPWIWLYGLLLVALGILTVVFVALGLDARVDEPTDVDLAVHSWVVKHRERWPLVTAIARYATRLGDHDTATTATVLVALGLLVLHKRRVHGVSKAEPYFWLGVIAGGGLVCNRLKLVFLRDRPPIHFRLVPEKTYSFPSGHSVFAANFFLMLGIHLARMIPAKRGALRIAAVAACAVMAFLVAASRIWLGVHYLTDVAGGLLFGVTWVLAAWVARIGWRRWCRGRAEEEGTLSEDE